MADCKYCGEPAGFLRKKHASCVTAAENGKRAISIAIYEALRDDSAIARVQSVVNEIVGRSRVPEAEKRAIVVDEVAKAVDFYLEDGVLDKAEESRIAELQEKFSLAQDDFAASGAYEKIVKAATLRDVMNGELPDRLALKGAVPFNLQKGKKNRLGIS